MSLEEFNNRADEAKKLVNGVRKDIRFRQEQEKRGQTTYSLDAEIRGQFKDLNNCIDQINKMMTAYKTKSKDYNIAPKELQRRQKLYEQLNNDKLSQQRVYDSFFKKKNDRNSLLGDQQEKVQKKYDTKNMTTKQMNQLRLEQQKEQDEAIDDLIDTVKNMKSGGKAINQQLVEQDDMLETLDHGIDENTQKMGKVRRNMMKLLEQSSNCCLVSVIVLQIAALICIIVFWR